MKKLKHSIRKLSYGIFILLVVLGIFVLVWKTSSAIFHFVNLKSSNKKLSESLTPTPQLSFEKKLACANAADKFLSSLNENITIPYIKYELRNSTYSIKFNSCLAEYTNGEYEKTYDVLSGNLLASLDNDNRSAYLYNDPKAIDADVLVFMLNLFQE